MQRTLEKPGRLRKSLSFGFGSILGGFLYWVLIQFSLNRLFDDNPLIFLFVFIVLLLFLNFLIVSLNKIIILKYSIMGSLVIVFALAYLIFGILGSCGGPKIYTTLSTFSLIIAILTFLGAIGLIIANAVFSRNILINKIGKKIKW